MDRSHARERIDELNVPSSQLNLRRTRHRVAGERSDVAVFVCFVEILVIDQLEVLDAKVSELLNHMRSKTATPDHRDLSRAQAVLPVASKETEVPS
jgi:hypothetical protein